MTSHLEHPVSVPSPSSARGSVMTTLLVTMIPLAMVVLWFSQALPLAVTALLPLAAYPLLSILPVKEVSQAYLDPAVFLFMGGFFIALAIEKWGLHRRMALHIVRAIGFGPRRIVFGFLLATAFLSMWISNTATAMLMLPIGLALLSAPNTTGRSRFKTPHEAPFVGPDNLLIVLGRNVVKRSCSHCEAA